LAVDEDEWSASRPSPQQKDPGTNWLRGWVGPRAGLNAMAKRKIPTAVK